MKPFLEAEYHRNVMELLVREEIERQTVKYSQQDLEYLNLVEVAAYALNRLPPLYATSHEGFYRQHKLGRESMVKQLRLIVARAIKMVGRDSPRLTTPLKPVDEIEIEKRMAKLAFTDLAQYLEQITTSQE